MHLGLFGWRDHGRFCRLLSSTFSPNQCLPRHMLQQNQKTANERHMTNFLEELYSCYLLEEFYSCYLQENNRQKKGKMTTHNQLTKQGPT